MGNTQIKQSMKCFECNEVSFITFEEKKEKKEFEPIIVMTCKNISGSHINKITLKEYFEHRQAFRGQKIACHNCKKYEKEMHICFKCQEIENKKNPTIYCQKCMEKHQSEEEGHLLLPIGYLNSKCHIHRKDFIAYDKEKEKNICEDCIKDYNKDKFIFFDGIKPNEQLIENLLETIKIEIAKINTIRTMNMTNDERERKEFKDYLQTKLYFIELEWLILGDFVNTPNNYQVIKNTNYLLENSLNTLKDYEIFNDNSTIGIKIKDIVEQKNKERKVLFTPVK